MGRENPGFFGEINDQRIVNFLTGNSSPEDYGRPSIILDRSRAPGIAFLRQVITFSDEVGVYKAKYGEWCGFSGKENKLFINMVDPNVEVFIHSHLSSDCDPALPSPLDLINYFDNAETVE